MVPDPRSEWLKAVRDAKWSMDRHGKIRTVIDNPSTETFQKVRQAWLRPQVLSSQPPFVTSAATHACNAGLLAALNRITVPDKKMTVRIPTSPELILHFQLIPSTLRRSWLLEVRLGSGDFPSSSSSLGPKWWSELGSFVSSREVQNMTRNPFNFYTEGQAMVSDSLLQQPSCYRTCPRTLWPRLNGPRN